MHAGATTPILVYLAAPVGAPDAAGVEANLWDAGLWLRYLVDLADERARQIAWCAPWYAYAATLDDRMGPYRRRGMRDACAALERADAFLAVGRLSRDVQDGMDLARSLGLPIASLVSHGKQPPPTVAPRWWENDPHRRIIEVLHGVVGAVEQRRASARQAIA
jgi:hypothetical protein